MADSTLTPFRHHKPEIVEADFKKATRPLRNEDHHRDPDDRRSLHRVIIEKSVNLRL
jgi:hypothetical protein